MLRRMKLCALGVLCAPFVFPFLFTATALADDDPRSPQAASEDDLRDPSSLPEPDGLAPAGHTHGHHGGSDPSPIGVMAAHVHGADQWMISYRYMYNRMDGILSGDRSLTYQEVRDQGYMSVPMNMDMHMHMVSAMYAPIDELTIALTLPVTHMSMHHRTGMAGQFDTRSAGIGDMRVAGLIRLFDDGNHQLLLGLGLVLPSGAIHVRGATPHGSHVRLPYPMRPGGGSVAGYPSVTYTGNVDIVSWGAQASAVLPMYDNEDGYRLGFEYLGTVWAGLQPLPWLGASLRVSGIGRDNIHGADADLDPTMVPTADPQLRALFRMEAYLGVSFSAPGTVLEGHRLALEAGLPFYQNLTGPQLGSVFTLVAGWQWTPQH